MPTDQQNDAVHSYFPHLLDREMQALDHPTKPGCDMAAIFYALENFHKNVQECRHPDEVLQLAQSYLNVLRLFRVSTFYLTDPYDMHFRLQQCDPESEQLAVENLVRECIHSGTFAWALRQNRAVAIQVGEAGQTLVLQSLSTRANTAGMFVGIPLRDFRHVRNLPLSLLSIILSNVAHALENHRLQNEIRRHNSDLQEKIHVRTIELTKSNEALNSEISQRRRSELELAQEKERLAITLRSIGDGVITTDTNGRIVLFNPATEQLLKLDHQQATGCTVADVLRFTGLHQHEPLSDPHYRVFTEKKIVESKEPVRWTSPDGEERLFSYTAAPIWNSDSTIAGSVIVLRDVTQKERQASELAKASKLESLGILAGGIAHDFRNILTAIIGNISLALNYTTDPETMVNWLNDAVKASLRAKDLTQQLLTFAKGGAPIKTTIKLNETIREATSFGLHGSNVQARLELPDDLWPVEADVGQINQVIHNIVINAMQAMPDGGTIQLHGANVELHANEIPTLPPGRYIRITIQDHGIGIPAKDLPRIFDPYFSTKNLGSGLGLATCYSIVKKHSGHLLARSEVGNGATFHIFLPAAFTTPQPSETARELDTEGGHGKILVMEDDTQLQHLYISILRRAGYDLEVASDGKDTIRKFQKAEKDGKPFDLVILDLTIPGGMGGRDTIKKLLEIKPDINALVASGYSNDPVMASHREFGFSGVINKPFTVSNLTEAIEAALARTATASR